MSPTEERLADDPISELWGEHRSRYRFGAQFAAGKRVLDVASGAGFGLETAGNLLPGAWTNVGEPIEILGGEITSPTRFPGEPGFIGSDSPLHSCPAVPLCRVWFWTLKLMITSKVSRRCS